MNDGDHSSVSYAQREVELTRTQFISTLAEIRRRTSPRVMVAETAKSVTARANDVIVTATTAIRGRPKVALAGLAAFILAVGFRYWRLRRKEY